MKNKEKLYGIGECEIVYASIEECLEDEYPEYDEYPEETPEAVEIFVYERVKINSENTAEYVLENLIEHLDDNYSSSKECWDADFKCSEDQKKAAKEFVDKILSNYKPYDCERTGEKITVKVSDYL